MRILKKDLWLYKIGRKRGSAVIQSFQSKKMLRKRRKKKKSANRIKEKSSNKLSNI